jgi:hypothetical protein
LYRRINDAREPAIPDDSSTQIYPTPETIGAACRFFRNEDAGVKQNYLQEAQRRQAGCLRS